ncbi:Opi1-domain-containing protein [Periconia macrospinosa]|uniref:Opi1-domain-containing protein n=1 Tax=Periconia macrospinosa TaxID=97972 RepID=A0A2V1DQY5_9PLEO|nr:Opi1-domain-containing protein [Periconia macrospinosa]
MQQERQSQPPAYTQHDPRSLNLPSVPTHSLPSLRSLDLPDAHHHHARGASMELSPKTTNAQWSQMSSSLNSTAFPRLPDGDIGSPMDTSSVISACDDRLREMSVSVDDPDVRLAAEALSGLGNPDFARSPTSRSMTLSARSPTTIPTEPEPLLTLLTSAHPWLGGSINGSISAYNTTKTYSPRFVKYGAELIERNIGSPVVNTVSSVGRRTGVEQNLRRYLGDVHRRPSDLEQGDTESERRKRQRIMSPADSDAMDIEEGTNSSRTRGGSHATKHIDSVMHALKLLLEEYETTLRNSRQSNSSTNEKSVETEEDEQVRRLASRMKSLSTDIWNTLQTVVQSVSRYTGGALPQNASQVVRTELLSVPQRWQLASRRTDAEEQQQQGEEVRGANRMLAFAKEGLDMMGQITAAVDGTVQSAETWLARIGRRPAGQQQDNGESSAAGAGEKAPLLEIKIGAGEKQ